MENIQLTSEETKELEKRGFLVKELITLNDFLKDITIWTIIFGLIGWFLGFALSQYYTYEVWSNSMIQYIVVVPLLLQVQHFLNYILGGKIFVWKANILIFWKLVESINAINKSSYVTRFIAFMRNHISSMTLQSVYTRSWDWALQMYIPILILISIWYWFSPWPHGATWSHGAMIFIMWALLIIYWAVLLIRFFLEIYHPLYAFGNLWEKIQKLTPQIATHSKAIEQNFASDMNYMVLSNGFDGLASTFSQIVSLVIRLEKTEQKANKGNLFDSEKYISSLRSDIVWPLRSLRSFLDGKRTELAASQQELSRVRVQVGGTSENRDLTSARTEPLMRELTENIDALDVMIGKMG